MTKPLSNNLPKSDVYRAEQPIYTNLTNSQTVTNEKDNQALTNQYSSLNDTLKYEGQMRRFQLAKIWANQNTAPDNKASVDGGGYLPKTVTFTPQELGIIAKKGKLPPQIEVDESHFEQKLFNSYGLDEFDPQDRAILQNIFQRENPGDGIDWKVDGKTINKLTAVLNSQGQYEVKVELRNETDKKLNQAFFNRVFFANQQLDSKLLDLLGTNASSGDFQQTAGNPDLTELALDMTQMGLDVIGIFEPTPFADLTNTGISVVRGNWGDAALSVLGVVPYVGDLAKLGKIPKWLKAIDKISNAIDKFKDVARYGGKGAEAVKEFVKKAKAVIDSLPIDKLPDALRDAVKSVKQKIDDFFASVKKTDNPADNVNPMVNKNADEIGDANKAADNTKSSDTAPVKQNDVQPPKKTEPKKPEITSASTEPSLAPNPNRLPEGKPKKTNPNDKDPNNIRAVIRENESANVLAQNGYKVKQLNDTTKGSIQGVKKPDFEIEGKIFDNYAPSANKGSRGIWSELEGKIVTKQADRFVINMNDSKLAVQELTKQFKDFPLENLKEILIIKDGKVIPFFPFN